VLKYTPAPGETNHLAMSYDFATARYVFEDTAVASIGVTAKGCSSGGPQVAYCAFGSFLSIDAHLGDGGPGYAIDNLDVTTVSIHGGTAADTLIGGVGGTVTLDGGGGYDSLTARGGQTTLAAGPGGAELFGGTGHSTYQGSPEADDIHARNGVAENVTCGGGADVVDADPNDTVAADCETVTRGEATATSDPTTEAPVAPSDPGTDLPGTATSAATGQGVTVSQAPVALDAHGRVPVAVTCTATTEGGCSGVVVLSVPAKAAGKGRIVAARRGRRVVGRSRRFRIAPGRKVIVPVELSRRGARVFRARGRRKPRRSVKLDAAVTVRTATGVKTTHTTITVKARRRPTPIHRRR
jgi:hypothetical protein